MDGEFGAEEGEKALDNVSATGMVAPGVKTNSKSYFCKRSSMRCIREGTLSMFRFKITCNGL